ncbi:accessory gene regulator ArgB-like protein [Bacillus sp. JCM 19034]|uniref:accessory gene regulator ArgB-like protein n=1 Tax=Bacillus sp. JCM 19034 TaxID=1481928 RepID=UPI000781785F|nr:accessory gene regulator B family protein [Bacillus sp. JCM 19034]
MITIMSRTIAKKLCGYLDKQEEVEYVRYGLEIIIGGLWKWVCLFGAAAILGVVPEMIGTLLTFAIFRVVTGGFHYSTYLRCLIAGLFSMLAISVIVSHVFVQLNEQVLFILIGCTFIIGLIMIYLYAPSNHFYKKMTNTHRKKLQQMAFVLLFVWVIINYNLVSIYYEIAWASTLGLLFQLSSTHPLSYKLVSKVENLIDWRSHNEKVH